MCDVCLNKLEINLVTNYDKICIRKTCIRLQSKQKCFMACVPHCRIMEWSPSTPLSYCVMLYVNPIVTLCHALSLPHCHIISCFMKSYLEWRCSVLRSARCSEWNLRFGKMACCSKRTQCYLRGIHIPTCTSDNRCQSLPAVISHKKITSFNVAVFFY